MNSLTRRSFLSSAAKVAALAALPAVGGLHQYLLTITDGAEGAVLAQIGFSGDVIPVNPQDYFPSSRLKWVVALVSGFPDGSERMSEYFECGQRSYQKHGPNFKLWEPVRRTKLSRGVEVRMLNERSWAHSRYICLDGHIIEMIK